VWDDWESLSLEVCTNFRQPSDNPQKGEAMSKRGRKRKSRAKSGANHGKRPNA